MHFEDGIKKGKTGYDTKALTAEEKAFRRVLHQTIKKVTEDVRDRFMFNTAISSIMELVNAFYGFQDKEMNSGLLRETADALLKLLAPFAPHITEELWHELGGKSSIHMQRWPEYDEEALKVDEIEIVCQVNGKVKSRLTIPAGASREEMQDLALADEKIKSLTAGKTVVKVIAVPKKLVNIVVKG